MNGKEWDKIWRETPHHYVDRDDYTISHVYTGGEKVATITGQGLVGEKKVEYFGIYNDPSKRVSLETMLKQHTVEKTFREEQFIAAREKATQVVKQFWDEFKNALFEYHNIQDHPKREKFFEILRSNNSAPSEIIGESEDWVELLK